MDLCDDLGRIRVNVPCRGKRAIIHVRPEDVLGIDRSAHGAKERCKGHWQNDPDRVLVQCCDGHLRFLPVAALLVREPEGERRPAAGRDIVVVDDPIEGEGHVVGGEALPIVPRDVFAQVEGPGQTVIRMFPGLCQRRLDLVRQPGGFGQAFKQVAQDARRLGVARNGQIQSQRLANSRERQSPARLPGGVLEDLGVLSELVDDCAVGGGCAIGVVRAGERYEHA